MELFGEPMKKQFLLSDDCTFINHGSYGAVARPVDEAKTRMKEEFESSPDRWFRRSHFDHYIENVEAAAKFVGAKPENTVLVRNATTGINAVLQSIDFKPGDVILTSTWTYGAVKNAVQWVSERTGAVIAMVDIRLPIKDKQEIIQSYRDVIAKHSNIKLAVLDIISSVPPVWLPFRELSVLCKEKGIQVLLDGAHTPGQIDVQLEQWAPDYYVGNLHKWAYTHRGCSVLYIHPDHQANTDPTVISAVLHGDDVRRRFFYQGTDDGTTFCVVKDAIKFYQECGGPSYISTYNNDLVTKAADMLTRRWGTGMLEIPRDMEAPYMRMVKLPVMKDFPVIPGKQGNVTKLFGDMTSLMFTLMDRFNIVALCLYCQGAPYVRISANIYNTMEDYDKLADAILRLNQ